ncbi:MAG: nucleotidyltransferase domain-containing protein [Candidatus Entotheonellia bacterium]
MVDRNCITDLVERIVQEFHPERVILFGSYASGNPSDGSDVDLLVILPYEGSGIHKAVEILTQVNPRLPVDLLVRTPEQIRERLAWHDFFLQEIMEKGQVLYESTHV